MAGSFPKLNSVCGLQLRMVSFITLGACIVLSLILEFGQPIYDYHELSNVQIRLGSFVIHSNFGDFPVLLAMYLLPGIILELGPFALGIYATHQKKAFFLLLCVLNAFILTGFILRHLIQFYAMKVNFGTYCLPVLRLLLLWFSAFVWYSYYEEIRAEKKTYQAANVPLNSDEQTKDRQEV